MGGEQLKPLRRNADVGDRHLAIASRFGHVATFDWHSGKLHSEIQLRESVRDIK